MEELISIIIPVYNVEKYLESCLNSIINQTYKNIEIIVINDGSTDNSLDIIKKYQEQDNRIILIDRENKGVLFTRVEGYKISNGKYITFVDSDDWIEENTIEILYNKCIKYNADVVKCNFSYNDSCEASGNLANIKGEHFITKDKFEPDFYDMFFKTMNIHTVWAQMFKKELLHNNMEKIDTSISLGDDLEFNVQLYKNINNILFIDDVLYHYRFNPLSITRRLNEKNIKNNIISVTKCYLNAYKVIDYFEINNAIVYKQNVIRNLLNEVNKWQIDLIGVSKDKKQCIEYLKWYYYEYDNMKLIKDECNKIQFDIKKLRYNRFYSKIYKNITLSYIIGKITFIIKKVYRNLKNKKHI